MNGHRYKIGDRIVLKEGPARSLKSAGACKILAALPESQGSRQYRVHFETENYDRMISEDDIDTGHSPVSGAVKTSAPASRGKEPWLKVNSVRTGK